MNKFINKILKEAEDFSDDFFQSKHVNKRKEDFENELSKRKREYLPKLIKGLKDVRIAYNNEYWESDKEELFLKLFSELHIENILYRNNDEYGYFLMNEHNNKECFYDLKSNYFWTDYSLIWKHFYIQYEMNYLDIELLIKNMIEKYFNLYNVIVSSLKIDKWY